MKQQLFNNNVTNKSEQLQQVEGDSQQQSNNNVTTLSKKKEKDNNIYSLVIDYLNKKASTNYRASTKNTQSFINARVKEARKKFKGDNFTDPTLIYLLMELIETIDDEFPNPGEIELWLRQLPMADTNTIIQHADKMNDSIGVDIELQCDCDICGLSFKTALRTTSEFFRPAVKF